MKRLNLNTKKTKIAKNKNSQVISKSYPKSGISKREKYLVKRIFITSGFTLLVIIITYFWMTLLLSNANSFWDLFRKKSLYQTKQLAVLPPPYLSKIPEAVNSQTIDLSGRSKPGTKVVLYVDNSKSQETISDGEGNYYFTSIPVGVFSQVFYTKAVDQTGNESKNSAEYKIVFDNIPPDIDISQPKEAEDYSSTGHSYTIKGTTEPGSSVTVNEKFAVVGQDGSFSVQIRLEEGGNKIKIKVVDKAGNEKEEERFINFTKVE